VRCDGSLELSARYRWNTLTAGARHTYSHSDMIAGYADRYTASFKGKLVDPLLVGPVIRSVMSATGEDMKFARNRRLASLIQLIGRVWM